MISAIGEGMTMDLTFIEIVNVLIRRFKIIILFSVLGLLIFYIYNHYIISPEYTSSAQLYVDQSEISDNADLNQLTYAQKVVTTYITFLKTTPFYERVSTKCGLAYTPNQLKKMTDIQDIDNTEIFKISVTTGSANDSYKIVRCMQELAPLIITQFKRDAQITVVDPAKYPGAPSGPNIFLNTILGGLFGFFLSLLSIFLWEVLNVKVKNQADLKNKYDIPVLGTIPDYSNKNRRVIYFLYHLPFIKNLRKITRYTKSTENESNFILTEAFHSLRTNLRFTLRNEGCKKILINSAVPDDGKSTVCSNLAISIAQTGARVLIMDCDLRKGILNLQFDLRNIPGVSDVLSGMADEKDAIQIAEFEHLHVLTAGSLPPNPGELLGSIQMEELLKRLEKVYDYIIIDTPPVNIVSDALSLAKLTDGIILVVREGATTHPNIQAAISTYHLSKCNILGLVLNAASHNRSYRRKSKYYYRRYKQDNG